tara:strand:- start:365 stop:595 length:231 start_codon:yes stop_codon:yes gene_type:complete
MIFYLLMSLALGQESDRQIQYQKKTEIDFEALDIEGEMVKPQGSLVMDRSRAAFNPLIRLRTDFNVEMSNSVTEIK